MSAPSQTTALTKDHSNNVSKQQSVLLNQHKVDISPIFEADISTGSQGNNHRQQMDRSLSEGGSKFIERKVYIFLHFIISLLYFLNVFIGMFLLDAEYDDKGSLGFYMAEQNYTLKDRTYDIIEVALLGLIVLDCTLKAVMIKNVRQESTVRLISFEKF